MKKFEDKSERLQIVAPASWVRTVDQWRSKQPGLPNRSSAIRQLATAGIQALSKPTAKQKRK